MKEKQNQLPDYLTTFHTAYDNLKEYIRLNHLTLQTIDPNSKVYTDYIESVDQVVKIVMNSHQKGSTGVSNYDMVRSLRESGEYDYQVIPPLTKDDEPYVIDDVLHTLCEKIHLRDYKDMYYINKNDAKHCYNSISLTIRHELSDMLKKVNKHRNDIPLDDESRPEPASNDLPVELRVEYLSRFLWQSKRLTGNELISIMAHTLDINTDSLSKKASSLNHNKRALAFDLAPKYLKECAKLGLHVNKKEYYEILKTATYGKATSAKSFEKERTEALRKREELNTEYSKM